MSPEEKVQRFLLALEANPALKDMPEFGLIRGALLLFPAEKVCSLIEWIVSCWGQLGQEQAA